jgi:acyl-coenzyme A thioesterase 9
MQVPWIEAFRKQQREAANKSQSEPPAPAKPDLMPKKMSDSYHSVVSATSTEKTY